MFFPVRRIATCTVLAALCMTVPAAAQTTDKTIAYYRFNEGPNGATVTTITDSGPNGLNGTAQLNKTGPGITPLKYTSNVASFPSTGSFSLDASGDYNFVSVPHNAAMVWQGSLTVEAFVRPNVPYDGTNTNIDSRGDDIVSKQNNLAGGDYLSAWALEFTQSTGLFHCTIGFAGDPYKMGIKLYGIHDFRDGKWHHIAMVLDRNALNVGQSLTLYVDGIQEAYISGNWPDLYYGTQPLLIGAGNYVTANGTGTYRRNFGGLIDEVRITAAALTPDQFLDVTTISGQLLFGGITALAPSPDVTFEFRPTDNSDIFTRTVSVLPTGIFNLSVPLKNYTVHVKADKYLAANVNVDMTNGSVSGLTVMLPAGDANNDNTVDIGDFGILVNAYGGDSSISGSSYDAHADFNGDGMVDIGDFGLLVNNYGLSGDL